MIKQSAIVYFLVFSAVSGLPALAGGANVKLADGRVMRVTVDAPEIFHIQVSRTGKFHPSILQRYGVVRSKWPAVQMQQSSMGDLIYFKTAAADLVVNRRTGNVQLLDRTGKVVLNHLSLTTKSSGAQGLAAYKRHQEWLASYFRYNPHEQTTGHAGTILGQEEKTDRPTKYIERYLTRWSIPHFGIRIGLNKSECLYGLGEASQKRISLRGYAYRNWVEYRGSHGFDAKYAKWEQTEGGIPFLMSTRGWAVLLNTSWPTYFDLGTYRKDEAYVWGPFGHLDMYLMAGGSLLRNINLYTQISGRPILLPEYGYGLWFDGNTLINQFEMLNDAVLFRRYKFPVDIYSLEPGWMQKNYDFSHHVDWNQRRFFVPTWCPERQTFIGAMRRLGIRMGLWFCCNDDLTLQAERLVAIRQGHPSTVPARPYDWYHHLRKFEREGIRAFKIDPADILNAHPGRKYFNGRTDLEMHNLTQTLLGQQMYQGAVKEGPQSPRIFTQYSGFYIGTQHWIANTTDDDSAGPGTLCWLLNLGLTGNMNVTADMDPNQGPAAIQMAFFSGWTDVQSWAYFGEPWLLGPKMQKIFRYYDDLRHRLIPYIYSAAWKGTQTGMPIMRAMPLVYPDDPQCANLRHEYMFGNAFLNVLFTNRAYLPSGEWINYWSGKLYHGGRWITLHVPTDRGGGLFVRAGSIVPTWPVVQYVSRVPVRNIGLSIWPRGNSKFKLYQDDGATYKYLKGQYATTPILCKSSKGSLILLIGPTTGSFGEREESKKGLVRNYSWLSQRMTRAGILRPAGWGFIPKNRVYTLRIHTDKPKSVTMDGHPVTPGPDGWWYKPASGPQTTGVFHMLVRTKAASRIRLVLNVKK